MNFKGGVAAPMKVTYGIVKLINKSNLGICEFLSPRIFTQPCANCFSTQASVCNGNRYSKQAILWTKTSQICNRVIKGSNSWNLKCCRTFSCIQGIQACKQLFNTNISNYVISGAKLNSCHNVRHRSDHTNEDGSKDYVTSKETFNLRPKRLKENIWTIPNLLTISRIILTPVIGYLVTTESYSVALGLFTFAGLTDLLDGYIARNFKNQMSAFGTALDPLADKILITVLTVTLASSALIPMPLAVLIIGRDALLVLTGFVIRFISLPPPVTFKRYFDATNPTAKLMPSTLSKYNTALQLSLVCFTLAAPVFNYVDHQLLQCLWYITGATTLASGVDYVINRKTYVKFLQKKDDVMK